MDRIKGYHVSGGIFAIVGVCLIIFASAWIIGIVCLAVAHQFIENGEEANEEKCKCNEQNGCKKDCGNDNNGTVVSDDSDSQKSDS